MCKCVKCGRTFALMFVAWLMGAEHRVCIEYPHCAEQQQRLDFAVALTTAPVLMRDRSQDRYDASRV